MFSISESTYHEVFHGGTFTRGNSAVNLGKAAIFVSVFIFAISFVGCTSLDCKSPCTLEGEYGVARIERIEGVEGLTTNNQKWPWIFSPGVSFNAEPRLRLFWNRLESEQLSTTLPYNMFRFVVDDTKETPTVEWVFCPPLRRADCRQACCVGRDQAQAQTCNHNRLLTNDELRHGRLCVAVVRISSARLESDVYRRQ